MAQKVLFIDRDGTLVIEPSDFQLDSLSKLEFYPKVFFYLSKIAKELDYEIVMVTNQDGLGTNSFPEETFWPTQNFIVNAFANEGIVFSEILIDKSFPHENAPTRKPRTGMLTKYLNNSDYNLAASLVIGDRLTDVELAKNLGAKAIFIPSTPNVNDVNAISNELAATIVLETTSWKAIYEYLKVDHRVATNIRKTNETAIQIELNLDGTGKSQINTGLPFFDHMLEQISKHGQMDLSIERECFSQF